LIILVEIRVAQAIEGWMRRIGEQDQYPGGLLLETRFQKVDEAV
jgi:hypothetical protein